MESKIESLEGMGTWDVVPRTSMPKGAKAIPSTWAFQIKRFPDGRLNKFKARWCVMGNRMERECIILRTPIPHLLAGPP
jgi:hypothetical protein